MSNITKVKKGNTGKLYSIFALKAALKCLQVMREQGLNCDPFLDAKYTIVHSDTKAKDKKYPITFSADASMLLTKLHDELYIELKELCYDKTTTLENMAQISAGESLHAYFKFMYRIVQQENTNLLERVPHITEISDEGYILTNVLNIVGRQRAQISGMIADCICNFNKILAYKIANYVWFHPGIINQKTLLMILGNMYMNTITLTNLYIDVPKSSINDLIKSFNESKNSQITIPADTTMLQSVPTQSVLTQSVPTHNTPVQSVLTQSILTQNTPVQSVLTQSVPTHNTPVQSVLTQSILTQNTPVQSVLTQSAPNAAKVTPSASLTMSMTEDELTKTLLALSHI